MKLMVILNEVRFNSLMCYVSLWTVFDPLSQSCGRFSQFEVLLYLGTVLTPGNNQPGNRYNNVIFIPGSVLGPPSGPGSGSNQIHHEVRHPSFFFVSLVVDLICLKCYFFFRDSLGPSSGPGSGIKQVPHVVRHPCFFVSLVVDLTNLICYFYSRERSGPSFWAL